LDPDKNPSADSYSDKELWAQGNVDEGGTALAQLSPGADEAIKKLNHTLDGVNRTMEDIRPQLTASMSRLQTILKHTDQVVLNFEKTSAATRDLLTDPTIRRTRDRVLAQLEAMVAETRLTARSISSDLREIVKHNKGKF